MLTLSHIQKRWDASKGAYAVFLRYKMFDCHLRYSPQRPHYKCPKTTHFTKENPDKWKVQGGELVHRCRKLWTRPDEFIMEILVPYSIGT